MVCCNWQRGVVAQESNDVQVWHAGLHLHAAPPYKTCKYTHLRATTPPYDSSRRREPRHGGLLESGAATQIGPGADAGAHGGLKMLNVTRQSGIFIQQLSL